MAVLVQTSEMEVQSRKQEAEIAELKRELAAKKMSHPEAEALAAQHRAAMDEAELKELRQKVN